ncbi:MAG: LysM peptidoglycan-binding domain-containing protein [Bacilli bacterium]|nr:LysM peptidoglycan-binding domain-containing protein [Bacilli bacterium]
MKKINIRRVINNNKLNSSYGTQYIIEENDNLYDIASRFNTSVSKLKELNNLTTNLLTPGEIITIDTLYDPKNPSLYKKYIVEKNDTLYSIAYNYGMTSEELLEINNLLEDTLKEGETIFVYNNLPLLNNEIIYTVKPGDSLYSIAQEYNTTIENIMSQNYLLNENLKVGTKLIITLGILKESKETETHIVLPNDNLYSIARKKGISVKELKEMNNLTSDDLSIGQQLLVPKENPNERSA